MAINESKQSKALLSVVIPAYNEEECIEACINEVTQVLKIAGIKHEIIVVNDGSSDGTLQTCINLKKVIPIRLLNLPVNSGHMAAITAGLEAANGNFVATMDADLQDPPADLINMYNIILRESDSRNARKVEVVQAFRANRTVDSTFKRVSAGIYYKAMERITGAHIISHAADFRIMTREVVDILISLPERNRIYRLLIPKLGFSIEPYPIIRAERYKGTSKYSFFKMTNLAIDSLLAFSIKPLRMFSCLGVILSLVFIVAAIAALVISMIYTTVPGWPSLVLLLLSANSFLFAGLGLVGEYIGRIYEISQARPIAHWDEIN